VRPCEVMPQPVVVAIALIVSVALTVIELLVPVEQVLEVVAAGIEQMTDACVVRSDADVITTTGCNTISGGLMYQFSSVIPSNMTINAVAVKVSFGLFSNSLIAISSTNSNSRTRLESFEEYPMRTAFRNRQSLPH
jgi:hypothetical protein